MSNRRELHRLTRQLKRWLEWQGEDDEMGVIPASEKKREAVQERIRERRRAEVERIETALREGPPEEAAESRGPSASAGKKGVSDGEEGVWRELGSMRRGGAGGGESKSTADEGGSASPESADDREGAPATKAEKLEYLRDYLGDCRRCPLWKNRNNIVFGEGDPEARLVFVGEAPGRREDETGRPFVGPAGELLNEMIRAMGLERDETYICNVLKSRPPRNRDPSPEEIRECFPFLQKQLEIIEPEVIVPLGRPATQNLLKTDRPLGAMRGRWHEWNEIPVMPTYHPAYLLRSPDQKRKTWNDLQQVIERLDLPGP